MGKLISYLLFGYVWTQAVDSPLRWMLGAVGLGPLLYLRDGALLLVAILAIAYSVHKHGDGRAKLALGGGLVSLLCVATLSGLPAGQSLFGLKVWLPAIAAFCVLDANLLRQLAMRNAWTVLLLVAVGGLILNYYFRFPWVGLSMDVGGVEVTGNREWTTFGVRRLSGFGRSSYDTAMLVLLLYCYLVVAYRSRLTQVLLTVIAGAGIAMTTSKGALGSFFLVVLFVLAFWCSARVPRLSAFGCAATIAACGLAALFAPLWSALADMPHFQYGSIQQKLFSSFAARGWETWPNALELLSGWQYFAGRGVGGIGVAQRIFESHIANPADNLAVYIYVSAGLAGILVYLFVLFGGLPREVESSRSRWSSLMMLCIFSYGITASVIENALFGLLCGFALAYVVSAAGSRPIERDVKPRVIRSLSTS